MTSASSPARLRGPGRHGRRRRRSVVGLWLAILALGLLTCFAEVFLRFPRTASAPRGLYLLTYRPPRRGSWVVACLPDAIATTGRDRGYLDAGRCAGTSEVLKRVAALPGDIVDLAAGGIRVNGAPLPGTARLARDSAGRPIPALSPGRYTVPAGAVWLLSTHHPRSWDSRYYGAVPLRGIRSTARRLWPPPAITR
jgi:conjugative transfer signal peptidase TraF